MGNILIFPLFESKINTCPFQKSSFSQVKKGYNILLTDGISAVLGSVILARRTLDNNTNLSLSLLKLWR